MLRGRQGDGVRGEELRTKRFRDAPVDTQLAPEKQTLMQTSLCSEE